MTNRRQFIQAASAAGLLAAANSAEASKTKLDCIDCHTHFFDPTRPEGIPWPRKGSKLYRKVLPEHLRQQVAAVPLTGTVIIEASHRLEDNQWLLDVAAKDPFVVGIVGRLKPGSKDFPKNLKRFTANKLWRGIRVGEGVITKPNKTTLRHLAMLAESGRQLDVNGGPTNPAKCGMLAKKIPNLRICVNHVGNLTIDGKQPPKLWRDGMALAATGKNVYCKVSALMYGAKRVKPKPPETIDFYRPVLDHLWKCFGEDRLIYGSDWPVSDSACTYRQQHQLVLNYFATRGGNALAKFFALNAKRAYKWQERKGRREKYLLP